MKTTFRLTLALFFSLSLYLCLIPSAFAEDVAINETNFPDEVFRNYVANFDIDGDGMFSEGEIFNVDSIKISDSNLTSLKGIEFFTKLKH